MPARSLGQEREKPRFSRLPSPLPPHPRQLYDLFRAISRKLRNCRDLSYLSYYIFLLGICTSCRKKLAMLMKGVAANKTDADEPEVRGSSKLAEKSPVSFENLRCHLAKSYLWLKPLRHLVINLLHFIVIRLSAKKKMSLLIQKIGKFKIYSLKLKNTNCFKLKNI